MDFATLVTNCVIEKVAQNIDTAQECVILRSMKFATIKVVFLLQHPNMIKLLM